MPETSTPHAATAPGSAVHRLAGDGGRPQIKGRFQHQRTNGRRAGQALAGWVWSGPTAVAPLTPPAPSQDGPEILQSIERLADALVEET